MDDENKKRRQAQLFLELERIANYIPVPLYWLDASGIVLGFNDLMCKELGGLEIGPKIRRRRHEDFYPEQVARVLNENSKKVIEAGKAIEFEEEIVNIRTGEFQYYRVIRSPLLDGNDNTIGIIGNLVKISVGKAADEDLRYEKILTHLRKVMEIIPIPIYWLDKKQRYMGVNNCVLQNIGANFSKRYLIGKSPLDVYPESMALDVMQHHNDVVLTGRSFSGEEAIEDITTKQVKYFEALIAPLRDDNGDIIGTIGTSLDITARKEVERLTLENKNQKIEHQQKLITLAHTVAHDISSPLSALNMMMHLCDELHENKRSVIKRATESILDIANNLLSTYRNEEQRATSELEQRQPLLISDLIVQLLSEKKAQYSNDPVRFEIQIDADAHFAFANMQASQFGRSLSNLVNNAVDALDKKSNGLITIKLTAGTQLVAVSVQDNGKGMSSCLVEKMLNRQSFTEGKKHGHGLGLQQIWSTLDYNQGEMIVNSTLGEGTTIQLTFSRIDEPIWIAQTIHLKLNSTVVILDDEESIHGAWDTRFAWYLKTYPTLQVHHFKQGQDALNFIYLLSLKDKERIVFLSDYELLRQDKNGFQIIEESGLKNTTLVTSYYANAKVRDKAILLGVKILPKQMASIVPIEMSVNHAYANY
ncbi:MAG: sensor histidine kinase [Solimicrobium sp.]|nr:sensor histidine kinase [Solimicrobium sp.]